MQNRRKERKLQHRNITLNGNDEQEKLKSVKSLEGEMLATQRMTSLVVQYLLVVKQQVSEDNIKEDEMRKDQTIH